MNPESDLSLISPEAPEAAGEAVPITKAPRETLEQLQVLRSARVSNIIAAHPDALGLLIAGGFPLLAQAPLRWAMAHTVNLGQAFRIAGLEDTQQEALLSALVRLDVPASLVGASHPAMPDQQLPDQELPDHEPEASFASDRPANPAVAPESHGHH